MASSSPSKILSPPQLQHLPASTKTLTLTLTPSMDVINKPRKPPQNPTTIDILSPSLEDLSLSKSSYLTRKELIRRRLHRLHRLSKVYRDHYWALMEDLRVQYREYYWKYGVNPHKEVEEREGGGVEREIGGFCVEGCGETNNNGFLGLGFGESLSESKFGGNNRCTFLGCKLKAMALTSFCHLHILSDPQQKLYKPCSYVIKSAQAGPILCGKPILRSTIPSLCNIHLQKGQKHVSRALKKAGLNVSSSSKLAPKFHVIVAEYVNEIQSKRRTSQRADGKNVTIKEKSTC